MDAYLKEKKGSIVFFPLFRNENRIFYSQLELNSNHLYSFELKEIVDNVYLFCSKMRANNFFFTPFA